MKSEYISSCFIEENKMHNFEYALWRKEFNNSERKIYMIYLSTEDDIMVLNKNTLTERGEDQRCVHPAG